MAQSEQEMQTRGRGVRPTAMNVLSGEDNYERWQTFREAYNDYARWEGVFAMEPELQLSNFRQCFGEANRALLRHLGLEAMVSGDRANPQRQGAVHNQSQRGDFKENNDLTLENALDLMRRHEDNEGALADIKDNRESVMSGSQEINAVSFRNSKKRPFRRTNTGRTNACSFCGSRHQPRKCPAYGYRCGKCGKNNHFDACCLTGEQTRVVETLEEGDDWCEDMFMAGTTDRVKRKFFTKLQLEDKTYLRGQIDTGATCNAMSWKDYSDLKKKGIVSHIDKKRRKPLKMYDNHVTMSLGVCRLPCSVNGRSFSLPFQVMNHGVEILISGYHAKKMGLIQFDQSVEAVYQIREKDSTSSGGGKALLDTYADIFEGLGEFGDP
ncbi:uncharacterized protein LOC108865073, partial [Galendromus occidentalis]|uniref:Uncharacterized protein LOC108865073 n=1 Tax=Galendromus occidentalis TaxID=34638 RepID=A0AAJ7L7F1_9ACAR